VNALAERRRTVALQHPIRSAIVAPTPVSFGFARMFQTLNDHPQIAISIFSTVEAAEAWLVSK